MRLVARILSRCAPRGGQAARSRGRRHWQPAWGSAGMSMAEPLAGWRVVGDDGFVTCAAVAQIPAADTAQVPGIVPSGFGDAVDCDVTRFRDSRLAEFDRGCRSGRLRARQRLRRTSTRRCDGLPLSEQRTPRHDARRRPSGSAGLRAQAQGGFKLNGVEFLVPISAWTASEPPRIMGQALKRADSLGIWYLHVWTWEPSPTGLFADSNRRVKCGISGSASAKPH